MDVSMQALVDNLGKALAAPSPDAKTIADLSGAIGMESCLKCHWVHFPAATAKAQWDTLSDLFK